MQINTKYNGKDVTITLTKEQLDEIAKQTKKYTLDDLTSYNRACEILNIACIERDYAETLKIIIKAANYIDNNYEEWIADFKDSNTIKYLPYHELKSSGWSFSGVSAYAWDCRYPVAYYYKKESTARTIAQRFNVLYNSWLNS